MAVKFIHRLVNIVSVLSIMIIFLGIYGTIPLSVKKAIFQQESEALYGRRSILGEKNFQSCDGL